MAPKIIVSENGSVQITKHHKIELGYAIIEAGVCFGVWNGIKGQIIQRKTAIRAIDMRLNIFCE